MPRPRRRQSRSCATGSAWRRLPGRGCALVRRATNRTAWRPATAARIASSAGLPAKWQNNRPTFDPPLGRCHFLIQIALEASERLADLFGFAQVANRVGNGVVVLQLEQRRALF